VWDLPSLAELDLQQNAILKLGSIGGAAPLRHLHLSRNKIREVPPELFRFRKLETLYLSHNLLKGVPNELAKLGKLTYLDLGHNDMQRIPAGVFKLSDLEEITLEGNPLKRTEVDKIFDEMLPVTGDDW
jgi:Leucine-rich repeat (LRR) protein